MKNKNTIKILEHKNRILKLREKLEINKNIQRGITTNINEIMYQIKNVEKDVEELVKLSVLKVSDHAVLRFLERSIGMDIEKIRRKLGNEKIQEQYRILGDGKYPLEGTNIKAVIKNNTLVTVI